MTENKEITMENQEKGEEAFVEESLIEITADDVNVEEELAREELYDTQHGDGHTFNPQEAAEQGLTYTPPTDPATVPSPDDPQGAEIAAGFAPSMEDLPGHVDESDLDIKADVREALRYNSETAGLDSIAVVVRQGIVYLFGSVPTEQDRTRVDRIVAELAGVVRVENHLWAEV